MNNLMNYIKEATYQKDWIPSRALRLVRVFS